MYLHDTCVFSKIRSETQKKLESRTMELKYSAFFAIFWQIFDIVSPFDAIVSIALRWEAYRGAYVVDENSTI